MALDRGLLVRDSRQINIQLDLLVNRLLAPADITVVQAQPCRQDDRRRLLFGTEKGLALQEFLIASIRAAHDRLYRDFTQEELSELDRLQKKMLRNLAGSGGENR